MVSLIRRMVFTAMYLETSNMIASNCQSRIFQSRIALQVDHEERDHQRTASCFAKRPYLLQCTVAFGLGFLQTLLVWLRNFQEESSTLSPPIYPVESSPGMLPLPPSTDIPAPLVSDCFIHDCPSPVTDCRHRFLLMGRIGSSPVRTCCVRRSACPRYVPIPPVGLPCSSNQSSP